MVQQLWYSVHPVSSTKGQLATMWQRLDTLSMHFLSWSASCCGRMKCVQFHLHFFSWPRFSEHLARWQWNLLLGMVCWREKGQMWYSSSSSFGCIRILFCSSITVQVACLVVCSACWLSPLWCAQNTYFLSHAQAKWHLLIILVAKQ